MLVQWNAITCACAVKEVHVLVLAMKQVLVEVEESAHLNIILY